MENEEKKPIDNIYSAIEAILFAAGHPITYGKLAEVLEKTEGEIKKIIRGYAEVYNAQENRGVILLTFDTSCQLCTKEQYLSFIKEALGIKKGGNLSASSLETLAIIAYNEPITKAQVEFIRKVDSTYIFNNLLEKNLIEVSGRLNEPGRPYVYRTTETFLRVFGIESLEQLPYVDLPKVFEQGEIIPIDIDLPKGTEEENE